MSAQPSPSLNEQLLLAVQRVDVEIVRDLLAAGADPNAREPFYSGRQGRAPATRNQPL